MTLIESPQALPALVDQLRLSSGFIHDQDGPLDERTRKQALVVARTIVDALEKPEEVVMRYTNEVYFCLDSSTKF